MDCNYYKCSKCGFTYQVPSYWSGYAPDKTLAMLHMNLETKEMCSDTNMTLIEDE